MKCGHNIGCLVIRFQGGVLFLPPLVGVQDNTKSHGCHVLNAAYKKLLLLLLVGLLDRLVHCIRFL